MPRGTGSAFTDIGVLRGEAENLLLRANLMSTLRASARALTQVLAAQRTTPSVLPPFPRDPMALVRPRGRTRSPEDSVGDLYSKPKWDLVRNRQLLELQRERGLGSKYAPDAKTISVGTPGGILWFAKAVGAPTAGVGLSWLRW
jgi:hypothetical protein